jgi:hypothetical protein
MCTFLSGGAAIRIRVGVIFTRFDEVTVGAEIPPACC